MNFVNCRPSISLESRLVSDLGVPGPHYSFCLPCSLKSRHLTFAVSKALPLAVPPALCLQKFSSIRIPVWILGSKVESSGHTTLTLAELVLLSGLSSSFAGHAARTWLWVPCVPLQELWKIRKDLYPSTLHCVSCCVISGEEVINYLPSRALCEKLKKKKNQLHVVIVHWFPPILIHWPMLGFPGLLWNKDVRGQR